MKNVLFSLSTAAFALFGLTTSGAAQTAAATTTYEVEAINEVAVTGNPGALVISTGAQLAGVSDASATWSVTTNQSAKKVTGSIGTAMPTGVTLKVNLTAPTGATSLGAVTLSTVAADLVTGISQVQAAELGMTYTLSALPTAGVIASSTTTVTYTITDAT